MIGTLPDLMDLLLVNSNVSCTADQCGCGEKQELRVIAPDTWATGLSLVKNSHGW